MVTFQDIIMAFANIIDFIKFKETEKINVSEKEVNISEQKSSKKVRMRCSKCGAFVDKTLKCKKCGEKDGKSFFY